MVMSPQLSVVEAPRTRRIPRTPAHTFYLETHPFGIYPFMIAPVLPGETLKNLLLQSRCVTDPVAGKLMGWWTEYYLFYVKLRDLPAAVSAAVETMILDPSATLAAIANSTDDDPTYFAPGAGNGVNWTQHCLQRVVECYFRDESEAWNNYTTPDGVPLAKLSERSWRDSLYAMSEVPTADTLVGVEPFEDFEARYRTWMLLRQQSLTDMTFEDYLATFGVNVGNAAAKGKPELIRYVRDWAYPSNTVDPYTGEVSSAVSWSVAERADKDRFFTEPGFVFGVTVARPKTYCADQKQAACCMLDNTFMWMPALLKDDPSSSLRQFASDAANSPLDATFASEHLIDVRDLYVHGDQFVYGQDWQWAEKAHMLGIRDDTHEGIQYPLATDVAQLWSDQDVVDPEHTATEICIRQDGIVKMTILGTQMDHT